MPICRPTYPVSAINITRSRNYTISMERPTYWGKHLLTLLTFCLLSLPVSAQGDQQYLSAKESEPANFGWMEGFPPPPAKRLHSWEGSFFEFPTIRWSVMHMREFVPTTRVFRGGGAASDLSYDFDDIVQPPVRHFARHMRNQLQTTPTLARRSLRTPTVQSAGKWRVVR